MSRPATGISLAATFFGGVVLACVLWVSAAWLLISDAPRVWSARAQVDTKAADQEGDELLKRASEKVREYTQQHGSPPQVLAGDESVPGCGFTLDELEGSYYVLANVVIRREEDSWVEIVAVPVTSAYPVLWMSFGATGYTDAGITDVEFFPLRAEQSQSHNGQ